MHPHIHCSIIYNSQDTEAAWVMDEQIKKFLYIYTMKYCSAIKKNEIFPICNNMDGLEGSMPSE